LRWKVERSADALTIRFEGDLGLGSGRAVDRQLFRLTLDGASEVIVDLRGATFIDSTGLRVLLELLSRSRRDGFALRVIPGDGQVRRAIEQSGLDTVLELGDEA
jgi:anti-anti-sigma factor